MVGRIRIVCLPAHMDSRDHQGHAGPDGRQRTGVSHAAYRMGRDVDQGVCDRADSADSCHYRPYMVSRTSVRQIVDEPQHALYRTRNTHSVAQFAMVAMVGQNIQRLQDLPASDQVHHAHGHVV